MDSNTVFHEPAMVCDVNAFLQILMHFIFHCLLCLFMLCLLSLAIELIYQVFFFWGLKAYFISFLTLFLVVTVIVVCVLKDEVHVRLLVFAVCWCNDRILSMDVKEFLFFLAVTVLKP